MISHKHKCIFIHISKCAGTTIEFSFGIDVKNYKAEENDYLFGWDKVNNLWLQHATPQQLLDLNYITKEQWDTYYKFIIYRNSWDRAYSDYKWMKEVKNVSDSFTNFLYKKGKYKKILNDNSKNYFVGDHLYPQKDYFFLDGKRINFDVEIDFDDLENGFKKITKDLGLKNDFFKYNLNKTKKDNSDHYSYFYNNKRKLIVQNLYKEDIDFFGFEFVDLKNNFQKLMSIIK
jgi:hypothetical protein